MIKIDIFSGFLGAGKTTLIKKLISEAYKDEKLVLIENEFGDIGIDGAFLQDSGIQINELNSGCICCSLVGDFSEALKKVADEYNPDRIIIEPSGVGKLSDVIRAVEKAGLEGAEINALATVADANKCKMYIKNFGEFFNDQIENAGCIVLSHTGNIPDEKLETALQLVKEHNPNAVIVTTDWDKLDGREILSAMERKDTIADELKKLEAEEECPVCGGHHHHDHEHHHDHDEYCHDHEHHHDHDECCHDHDHEHHHDHDECCHDHEHHHNHDECCHDHDHEHHHDHDECCHDHNHSHHHHADEVFTSCGYETTHKYTKEEMENILNELTNEDKYGLILRAKGIVLSADGQWIHFDYVPGEPDVRFGSAVVCGRICVIGSKVNENNIKELFSL